jgi:excisionase family DNA binding protein
MDELFTLPVEVDPQEIERIMEKVFMFMINVGIEETKSSKVYSTGTVAQFFGVSVNTVHNWVKEGKLKGIEKGERFRHIRIPENAVHVPTFGQPVTVKEAAEAYELERKTSSLRSLTAAEELRELLDSIVFYEKKYGGTFEETLKLKGKLNFQEERDAREWKALLRATQERKE